MTEGAADSAVWTLIFACVRALPLRRPVLAGVDGGLLLCFGCAACVRVLGGEGDDDDEHGSSEFCLIDEVKSKWWPGIGTVGWEVGKGQRRRL